MAIHLECLYGKVMEGEADCVRLCPHLIHINKQRSNRHMSSHTQCTTVCSEFFGSTQKEARSRHVNHNMEYSVVYTQVSIRSLGVRDFMMGKRA